MLPAFDLFHVERKAPKLFSPLDVASVDALVSSICIKAITPGTLCDSQDKKTETEGGW